MNLWGKNWTREEFRPHVGRMAQIAGIARTVQQDGFERGVESLEVRTGSGLRFGVCPSRGLDITFAEHNGRAIGWHSGTGWRHPAYYSESNFGWLRGFGGGLMTTCGFNSFGRPCEEEGEAYGLHDRASYIPAENYSIHQDWVGDEYEMTIEGTVRETRVFGANILLTRRITARAGEDRFFVHDELRNDGFSSAPAVILYHCNFGFPVVSEHSRVQLPTDGKPRLMTPHEFSETWAQMEPPQPDFAERCYFHDCQPDENGRARAAIYNHEMGFGGYVEFSTAQMPYLTQWKMMGAGDYVCGLEPSNAPLAPRDEARASGALPFLEPGETREFDLEFGVLS